MNIEKANIEDYQIIVKMFYNFTKEVYKTMTLGPKATFHKLVLGWYAKGIDIHVVKQNNKIIGFTMCYVDTFAGILNPVYRCEVTYVKPKFRKTRACYILMTEVIKRAESVGLKVHSKASTYNNTENLHKRLGAKQIFIETER